MQKIYINFDIPQKFEISNVKKLSGIVGLYFIFTSTTKIQYPFNESRLLYIGMSEKKTNSIRSRLSGHFDGKSNNIGLQNYRKTEQLYFTYINFEMLKSFWELRIEDLESYFILNFVKNHGVYPICNNKTGYEILKNDININISVNWDYFK